MIATDVEPGSRIRLPWHALLMLCALCGAVLACTDQARAQGGGNRNSADSVPVTRADTAHHAAHADSLHVDSTAVPHRRGLRFASAGAPLGSVAAFDPAGVAAIANRDLVWDRYSTMYEPLETRLPAYPLTLGTPGAVRAFAYAGAAPEAVAVSYNGMPLWGNGGRFDTELYPMEFAERIEITRGARAAILGSGESLIAVNAVAPRYDVDGSYVHLWYAQGPNNTTNADITYARNVSSTANLSLGFRRLASDGIVRLDHQKVSGWSARGMVRWEPSPFVAVSVTELFSDHTRGLNGGLGTYSLSNAVLPVLGQDSISERTLRHDVTVAGRWYPIAINDAVPDTAVRVDAAVYAAYAERNLVSGDAELAVPEFDRDANRGGRYGARAALTTIIGPLRIVGNGAIQGGGGEDARIDLGGLLQADAGAVMVRGGARLHTVANQYSHLILAAEGELRAADALRLRASVRTTVVAGETGCPPTTVSGGDTARSLSGWYSGQVAEASLTFRQPWLTASLDAVLRNAVPPECLKGSFSNYTVAGGAASLVVPIAFLAVDQRAVLTAMPSEYRSIPLVYGVTDISGRFDLFQGNLNLKLGTSLTYISKGSGLYYDDVTAQFYSQRTDTAGGAPFPLWNVYGQARIGSAYIRAEMRNLLAARFEGVAGHPEYGRGFYLGASWSLSD